MCSQPFAQRVLCICFPHKNGAWAGALSRISPTDPRVLGLTILLSPLPTQVRLIGRVIVGIGIIAGLWALYTPPSYEVMDTFELRSDQRDEMIKRIEEFTGEEFPDKPPGQ